MPSFFVLTFFIITSFVWTSILLFWRLECFSNVLDFAFSKCYILLQKTRFSSQFVLNYLLGLTVLLINLIKKWRPSLSSWFRTILLGVRWLRIRRRRSEFHFRKARNTWKKCYFDHISMTYGWCKWEDVPVYTKLGLRVYRGKGGL